MPRRSVAALEREIAELRPDAEAWRQYTAERDARWDRPMTHSDLCWRWHVPCFEAKLTAERDAAVADGVTLRDGWARTLEIAQALKDVLEAAYFGGPGVVADDVVARLQDAVSTEHHILRATLAGQLHRPEESARGD